MTFIRTEDSLFKILCLLFVTLGIFARVLLFVSNPDLWFDDAMLSASVWFSSWKDIFAGHLPYNQTAPLGFILSIKALATVFGDSEYVLRFLPLMAGIALLPLAYSFAEREFGIKVAAVFLFFLVCSDPLLVYSIQFKQYSLEAFFALAFLNAYSLYRKDILKTGTVPWKLFLLAFVGTQFGNTAFFILFGILVAMFVENKNNVILLLKNNWYKFLLFMVYAGLYYILWLSQVDAVKSGFMDEWWKPHFLTDFKYFDKWILNYIVCILSYFVDFTPSLVINTLIFMSCFLVGTYILFKQKMYMGITIISVVLVIFLLYFMQIYPLGTPLDYSYIMRIVGIRMLIYFIPFALLGVSIFVAKLFEFRINKYILSVLCLFIIVFSIFFNLERLKKGAWHLEIEKYVDLIENDENLENCNLVMTETAEPIYSYYHRPSGDKEEWVIPVTNDINFTNKRAFYKGISVENIFETLKKTDKNCSIFVMAHRISYEIKYTENIFNYVEHNYRGKVIRFDGRFSAAFFIDMKN